MKPKILKNKNEIKKVMKMIKSSIDNKIDKDSPLVESDLVPLQLWHNISESHLYDNEVVTKEPNCTELGIRTFTCKCGNIITEDIPIDVTNHQYDSTDHCIRCNILNPNHIHNYVSEITKEPTHTENGVRTYTCICGDTYIEEIPKLGHTYDQGVITKQPTCTEKGIKTYTCIGEDDSYTEEIPALGHNFDADNVCTRCGIIKDIIAPDDEISNYQRYEIVTDTDGVECIKLDYRERAPENLIFYNKYRVNGKLYPLILNRAGMLGYNENVKTVTIHNGVRFIDETIGDNQTPGALTFYSYEILEKVDGLKYISKYIKSPINTSYLFYGCSKLKNINLSECLSNVEISNAASMFSGCTELTTLDLTCLRFNSADISCNTMFKDCTNLKEIKVSAANWKLPKTNAEAIANRKTKYMFSGSGVDHVTLV